jgi:long-chain fatty acid transport protein
MKTAKRILLTFSCLVFLSLSLMANGLNLNSLGTKALTMGGAFVGLADDFSAIFWNPAGIAHFKNKYFGFYGTDIIPSGTYGLSIGGLPVVDAKTVTKNYLGGMAAYYHPINEKVVVGFGVYTPSGLGAEWEGKDFAAVAANNPNIEWRSKIGLVTFSPAIAFAINEKVSVGAALNINYGMFDIAFHAGTTEVPVPPYEVDMGQYDESMKGWGYGATFGVLVQPSEILSLGATFRTASKISFKGDASIPNLSLIGAALGTSINPTSDLDREVTWPMWLAAGVALKPIEALTITADVQFTQWSKIEVIKTDYTDTFWQILMEDAQERPMYWEDAIQFRLGAEYRLNAWAFRAGYYWDPSPAPDKTMNVLLPSFDFNVLTAGIGYSMDTLRIEFGVEYLMGKERTVDLLKTIIDPEWETAMPGTYNMNVIVPNLSISYRF